MENKNNYTGKGLGFIGALALVFIVLKLLGKISWSWWWVLSPIWIPASICAVVIMMIFLITIIVKTIEVIKKGE